MNLTQYIIKVATYPGGAQRKGQYAFNLLHEHRPELANATRGTSLDPFHRDDVLPEFMMYVEKNWGPHGE